MKKKVVLVFTITMLIFHFFMGIVSAEALTSAQSRYTGVPITIKIATSSNMVDVKTVGAYKMAEELEARSDGLIAVEVYPASQLLNQSAMVEGISSGIADMSFATLGQFTLVPEVDVLGLIGVFDSAEHYWRTCESEGGMFDFLADLFYNKADVYVTSFLYCGMSEWLYCRDKSIRLPEDMKGLKFRTPNPAMRGAVEALGAIPVTIPSSETYTALQSGMFRGGWGSIANVSGYALTEVAKYLTRLSLCYSDAYGIIIGKDTWDKWPEELRVVVQEISDEIYKFNFEYIEKQVNEQVEKWEADTELTFYTVPEEDLPKFAEIIGPKQLDMIQKNISQESYQHIIDLIEKYR